MAGLTAIRPQCWLWTESQFGIAATELPHGIIVVLFLERFRLTILTVRFPAILIAPRCCRLVKERQTVSTETARYSAMS
jgi:hypothetical protein